MKDIDYMFRTRDSRDQKFVSKAKTNDYASTRVGSTKAVRLQPIHNRFREDPYVSSNKAARLADFKQKVKSM